MRKQPTYPYFLIFISLLALMSLPKESSEKLRGFTVALLAPSWQHLIAAKSFISSKLSATEDPSTATPIQEHEKLRLENALLKAEISHLKEVMQHELRLLTQIASAHDKDDDLRKTSSLLKKRHLHDFQKLLQIQLQAVPAQIIFRSPSSWNSSFWINVGSTTNDFLGATIIAKNSPVLVGTSVIGIIDYVGKKQSCVRLITDSGLSPSVRALRGASESYRICEKINALIQLLEKYNNAIEDPQIREDLIMRLEAAAGLLHSDQSFRYLAKGELHGSSKPIWRSQRHQLQGIGFNYDYADGEGPSRDLRSGKPYDHNLQTPAMPILKVGDLLVTTGMDGVFPKDLPIAEVTHVHMLKEGDYYYELDALPTVGNLDDLSFVFVIPPVGYDPDEKPPLPGFVTD